MKKKNNVGIGILLGGIVLYMIFTDEIPGYMQALIIGLMIGSAFVLSGILDAESNNNK